MLGGYLDAFAYHLGNPYWILGGRYLSFGKIWRISVDVHFVHFLEWLNW